MSRQTESVSPGDQTLRGPLTLESSGGAPTVLGPTDTGVRTHAGIDVTLSGEPLELQPGRARLRWWALDTMRADDTGLVHGGFVFSLADHAAMLAINHPHVVLGSSECRFLAPVKVGETLEAFAELERVEGKKHFVRVAVRRADVMGEASVGDGAEAAGEEVFVGTFTCFVPARHVLAADGAAQ